MSEFTPITTQEDFDARIKDRIERVEKKYADYLSQEDFNLRTEDLNKQVSELSNTLSAANEKAAADAETISQLQLRVKNYETASVKSRIAHEFGIDGLADRISGDTEESIREDAKALAETIGRRRETIPLYNPDAAEKAKSEWSDVLEKMNKDRR